MTDIELENKKKFARTLPFGSKEQTECSCIDMINSILCYQCAGYTNAESVFKHEQQAYHNYLAQYTEKLGRNRVIELIQGQINSIKKINRAVFTDSDGLSYNSIEWN